jgi:hypothetical protein
VVRSALARTVAATSATRLPASASDLLIVDENVADAMLHSFTGRGNTTSSARDAWLTRPSRR